MIILPQKTLTPKHQTTPPAFWNNRCVLHHGKIIFSISKKQKHSSNNHSSVQKWAPPKLKSVRSTSNGSLYTEHHETMFLGLDGYKENVASHPKGAPILPWRVSSFRVLVLMRNRKTVSKWNQYGTKSIHSNLLRLRFLFGMFLLPSPRFNHGKWRLVILGSSPATHLWKLSANHFGEVMAVMTCISPWDVPIGSMGRTVYLSTWMLDFYGKCT